MAKKLRAELQIETAGAKRSLDGLAGVASASMPAASTRKVASGADAAARSLDGLSKRASGADAGLKAATKAFTGMAVGMAAGYAANNMKPGAARDMVEYGGAAASGAMIGMVAGPIGAALGALGGMLKTYLDRENVKKNATEDFMRGEHDYKANREFKRLVEDLTDTGDEFERLEENIEKAKEKLASYQEGEQKLIDLVGKFRDKGDEKSAKIEEGYLATNRQRQESLEGVVKSLERQQKDLAKKRESEREQRTSFSSLDSLSKVGGYMYGGSPDSLTLMEGLRDWSADNRRLNADVVDVLKRIEQNTKERQATWR